MQNDQSRYDKLSCHFRPLVRARVATTCSVAHSSTVLMHTCTGIRLLGGFRLRCLVLVTVMPEMAGIFPGLMLAISTHR